MKIPQCDERENECKINEMEVLHSAAGYYLGWFCSEYGPWDRFSGYFSTEDEAQEDLNKWKKEPLYVQNS